MTNNFPPNTDPNIFALTGVIAGVLLTGNFNSYEINAIGNWLELVGQYLLAYGAQLQLIQSRSQNFNSNFNFNYQNELSTLITAINQIKEELEKIKNDF